MTEFAAARRMMVDCQIRPSDVTDLRLIGAMLEVPRERFVPDPRLAYLDLDIPLAAGSTRALLKPMVLGKLLQAAGVGAGDSVLDVGGGTGYSAAVLGRLAGAVVALEEDQALAASTEGNLRAVGAGNVAVVTGTLASGWPAGGPYDVILLNGASEVAPKALLRQLKEGGRLVGIVGRPPASKAMLYLASGSDVSGRPIFDAIAPMLPGLAQPPAFVF